MVNIKLINRVSAVLSLFIYIFMIFIVVIINSDGFKRVQNYGYDVKEAVIISLENISTDEKKTTSDSNNVVKKPLIKVSDTLKGSSKNDSRDIIKKEVKDLFSTLRVDNKLSNDLKDSVKQLKTRSSRLKKQSAKELFKGQKPTKEVKSELLKIKKLLSSNSVGGKLKGDRDSKFFIKLSSIIKQRWNETIATQDGLKATVILRIDRYGKLSYRNLKLSLNDAFDAKLKDFLDTLTKESLPRYRDGDFVEAEFIFTDREESI
jgi:hypothetical protein